MQRKCKVKDYMLTQPMNCQFSIEFHAEYDGWRRRRPQWGTLCWLIEIDASHNAVCDAAYAAGVTHEELQYMKTQFAHRQNNKDDIVSSFESILNDIQESIKEAEKEKDKDKAILLWDIQRQIRLSMGKVIDDIAQQKKD